MIESKSWDWKVVEDPVWLTPSPESHWLASRWADAGFSDLLDLGCGLGRHSVHFVRHHFHVSAFDLSNDGIENLKSWASKEGVAITTAVGDMMHLPYPDSSIDCVLAYHVIYHSDTVGTMRVIGEIRRVLRPGGEFYITFISKSGSGFVSGKYPMIDENTRLKTDDGPEKNVPHFYADFNLITRLFEGCKLIQVRHIEEIHLDNGGSSWHYHVLGCVI